MKANKPKDAAAAYAKAVSLDPHKSGLLQVSLRPGAAGDRRPGVAGEGGDAAQHRPRPRQGKHERIPYLAQAYGKLGEIPQAELATAEGHFYGGDYKDAKIFAMRAQQKMKRGAPGWVRAQDIINFRTKKKK